MAEWSRGFKKMAEEAGLYADAVKLRNESRPALGNVGARDHAEKWVKDRIIARQQEDYADQSTDDEGRQRATGIGKLAITKTAEGLPLYPHPELFIDPPAKESDARLNRKWVYQHYGFPADQLRPEMCPNASAWRLLIQARADERWFIEKVYQGMKPTASELDEARRRDDSLPIREELTAFIADYQKAGA